MNNAEEFVKGKMKNIAQKVENELPNGFGFVVLAFSFNTEPNTSQMMYVSNAVETFSKIGKSSNVSL